MKHLQNIALLISCITVVGFSSCTKNLDNFGPQNPNSENAIPVLDRIIVLNEGNFNWGNGSVSVVDESNQTVVNEVFKQSNGVPLGDVPQSMIVHDSLGYIVVNNSGKIEVVNMDNFSSVKTITGFTSPRYIQIVSTKPLIAWVTDLYANKIWKVDLDQGQIMGSISSQGWNERMYVYNGNCFVLNLTDSVVNVFDINSEALVHTYSTGSKIADFTPWSDHQLMVIANQGIYKLDLNTLGFEDEIYVFPTLLTPTHLSADTVNEILYFIDNGGVQRLNVNPVNIVEEIIPSHEGSNWYGLSVHPYSGRILVTDAKDYVQPGEIQSYSADLSDSIVYHVGINPQFLFLE